MLQESCCNPWTKINHSNTSDSSHDGSNSFTKPLTKGWSVKVSKEVLETAKNTKISNSSDQLSQNNCFKPGQYERQINGCIRSDLNHDSIKGIKKWNNKNYLYWSEKWKMTEEKWPRNGFMDNCKICFTLHFGRGYIGFRQNYGKFISQGYGPHSNAYEVY